MWRILFICISMLVTGIPCHAQSVIKLARIADIPDQFVGGEILRAVYARLNISIEFADVPGKRALALSSAGELDGEVHRIANLSQTIRRWCRSRRRSTTSSRPSSRRRFDFDVKGWDSIRDYSVGIVRGVGSSEAGTRGMSRVTAATSLENMIRMLDAGRFDLMVTDLFSGLVAVRKLNLQSRIAALSPPLQRIYIYHYLHERHRDLARRVEAVRPGDGAQAANWSGCARRSSNRC